MRLGDLFLLAPRWCVFVSPIRIDLLCYTDFIITHWQFPYVCFFVLFVCLLMVTSHLPSDIASVKPGVLCRGSLAVKARHNLTRRFCFLPLIFPFQFCPTLPPGIYSILMWS
ncbi:uncharacterized protein C8R40DRAFT_807047 [Lentinula edodes]|uniref:uncharacterized protein n=1 Tax=Lentinula edodes TaxID=5353 RepID=UPI001E8C9FD6|nr:uncharacterized protein C8R40DRAFT_807047 [Lentinula edodes]KAH7868811.1 hypothetical protein C8R40DRAFT_807047 [Lentinula edodes]